MEKEQKNYKVSLFHNVKSAPAGEQTLDEIYRDIKNELYADEINQLRQYINAKLEDEADEYKKTLPAFTTSLFNTKRMANAHYITAYHGTITLDFDGIEYPELIIQEIAADAFVKLVFISPSGAGIKAVIETDNTDWTKHAEVFRQTSQYFLDTYGLQADGQCKDLTRLCFFSSDGNAFWNANNSIFHIDLVESTLNPRVYKVPQSEKRDSLTLDERYNKIKTWVEGRVKFEESQRHQHVLLMSGECNRWGLSEDYVLTKLVEDYEEDGFLESEIVTTVKSAFRNYAHEHGKFLIAPPPLNMQSENEWINDKQLASMPMPEKVWLMEDLIRRVGFTLIASPPGIGKSTLCRQIGIHIVYKHDSVIGKRLYPEYNRAIFVSWEDDWLAVKESYDKQIKALDISPSGDFQFYFPNTNNVYTVLANLEQKIKDMNGVDVIFLDCWNAIYSGLGKETTNTLGQRNLVDIIEEWCQKNQVAVLGIHHPIKSNYQEQPTMQSLSGGGGLIERCRAILALSELQSENADCIYLTVTKGNLIKPVYRRQFIEIAREEGTFIYNATGRIIPKGGSAFGMKREVKKQDSMEKRKKIIAEIFATENSLQHGRFCQLYKEKTGLSLVTAARHLAEMATKDGIVDYDEMTGLYSLKMDKQILNSPTPTDIENNKSEVMQSVDENYEDCPF